MPIAIEETHFPGMFSRALDVVVITVVVSVAAVDVCPSCDGVETGPVFTFVPVLEIVLSVVVVIDESSGGVTVSVAKASEMELFS